MHDDDDDDDKPTTNADTKHRSTSNLFHKRQHFQPNMDSRDPNIWRFRVDLLFKDDRLKLNTPADNSELGDAAIFNYSNRFPSLLHRLHRQAKNFQSIKLNSTTFNENILIASFPSSIRHELQKHTPIQYF